eukprot:COSAG01_NODE_152_length_23937_cov_122.193976_23_plen_114_part_00
MTLEAPEKVGLRTGYKPSVTGFGVTPDGTASTTPPAATFVGVSAFSGGGGVGFSFGSGGSAGGTGALAGNAGGGPMATPKFSFSTSSPGAGKGALSQPSAFKFKGTTKQLPAA